MKTASIFPTGIFSTAAEYVAQYRNTDPSLAWDSIGIADWSGLCRILEIDAQELTGGKFRRAIDAAYKNIQAGLNGGSLKPSPINTRVDSNSRVEAIPNLPVAPANIGQAQPVVREVSNTQDARQRLLNTKKGGNEEAPVIPIPQPEPVKLETTIVVNDTLTAKVEEAKAEIAEIEAQKAADLAVKEEKLKPTPKAAKAPKTTEAPAPQPAQPEAPKSTKEKLLELLAEVEANENKGGVDEEAVREIVREAMEVEFEGFNDKVSEALQSVLDFTKERTVKTLEVSVNGMPAVNVGMAHFKFPKLLRAAQARVHMFWVGEAGSGKSHTAAQIAEALQLPFHETSVCNQTSKTDLLGYTSITTGAVIRTEFREAFENGGVFLLDEIDNGNANVLSVINTALSNGRCAFPDGIIKKNDDFVLIATGNTYGNGANRQYVGRNQIDAATLNRFVIEEFPYDEDLEMAIAGNPEFTNYVQQVRAEMQTERVIVSPRASINGAKLLAAGWDVMEVVESVLIAGWPQNLREKALALMQSCGF